MYWGWGIDNWGQWLNQSIRTVLGVQENIHISTMGLSVSHNSFFFFFFVMNQASNCAWIISWGESNYSGIMLTKCWGFLTSSIVTVPLYNTSVRNVYGFCPWESFKPSLSYPLKFEFLKCNFIKIQYNYNQTVFNVSYRISNYFLKICAH